MDEDMMVYYGMMVYVKSHVYVHSTVGYSHDPLLARASHSSKASADYHNAPLRLQTKIVETNKEHPCFGGTPAWLGTPQLGLQRHHQHRDMHVVIA